MAPWSRRRRWRTAAKIVPGMQVKGITLTIPAASSRAYSTVFPALKAEMDRIALARGEQLVEAHHRFSKVMKERARYQTVEPVLPMDVLGVYVILPEVK